MCVKTRGAAPCQPMNTAEGNDCATARAASIDERGPAAEPITPSGGRSGGGGGRARRAAGGAGVRGRRAGAPGGPRGARDEVGRHAGAEERVRRLPLPGEVLDLGGRD